MHSVNHKQCQHYIFNIKSLTVVGNAIFIVFSFYYMLHNGGTSIEYMTIRSDYLSGYRNYSLLSIQSVVGLVQ